MEQSPAIRIGASPRVWDEVSGAEIDAGCGPIALGYERDALGRLTEVVDASDGTTTVWGYGYDAVGRLETVTQDSVAYASYVYDANGNRLTRTTGSGTETGVYDAQDRLTSYGGATYTYTAAGELSERVEGADTTRYDYDALGNLIEVELPDGTVVAYTIDGRNRRVGRSVDGAAVQGLLYGDQLNPVAELDSAGAVVSRFVYGTKANVPDYVVRGGATYRVLSDHLGSVRLVVDATTGSVAQRLSYDAWGRVLEDTSPGFQPFGFAGGITDPLTGLVRFGARDYDPSVGRWTSKDPIGFEGGSANLYEYSASDPLNLRDASGLSWRCYADVVLNTGLNLIPGVPILEALGLLPVSVNPFQAAVGEANLFSGGGFFGATNSIASFAREYHRTRYQLGGGNFGLGRLQDLTTRRGFSDLSLRRQGRLLGRLANLQQLRRGVRLASRALAISVALDAASGLLSCACRQ